MSTSISVRAFAGENDDYKRYVNVVKACIENRIEYPQEVIKFFKGRLGGDDLEDILRDKVMQHLDKGIELPLPLERTKAKDGYVLRVKDIPKEVDLIYITFA